MTLKIALLKEIRPHERRVALVPVVAAKLVRLGAQILIQAGAGLSAGFPDDAYEGAMVSQDPASMLAEEQAALGHQHRRCDRG